MGFPVGKKLALGLAAAGVTAAVVSIASFALFTSAAASSKATFTAGTVILTTDSPAALNCGVDASILEAGDSGSCTYDVAYSGSLDAWVGLKVSATSSGITAYTPTGSATSLGGEALLNDAAASDDTNGLVVSLSGTTGSLTQDFGMPTITCTAQTANAGETCSGANTTPQLWKGTVDTTTNDAPTGSWNNAETGTVTVNYSLPLAAGNAYQGSTATITLQAMAVQASNNGLSSGQPTLGWSQTSSNS